MSSPYDGSAQQYDVVVEKSHMVPMRDGTMLAADFYFPANGSQRQGGPFPVILERTPYDKSASRQVTKGKYFARRGYVCAVQDVRGRFQSEGEWYAFAEEASDGFDTVQWLGNQSWSNGKIGTMGDSYAGSDQAALATLNPSCLETMIVAVGASNYYHSSMRQNGALEQRFLIYAFRMAITSKEAAADPSLKQALSRLLSEEMGQVVRTFPLEPGQTILRRIPSYERWALDILTHGEYGDYWKQRGYAPSEYYEQHADVPTLYLGGWYDSYARNTCESYEQLSKIKTTSQKLLMGPWTHGAYEVTYSGDMDFGQEAHIHYLDLKLSWFDHYLKGLHTEVAEWSSVRYFCMGTGTGKINDENRLDHGGNWRSSSDWPLLDTRMTPYFFHESGRLSPEAPDESHSESSGFTYDPLNPVPTIGGGISAAEPIMQPGSFDQRNDPRFFGCEGTMPLSTRSDVLTFESERLEQDVEVTGAIEVHLWVSSTAVDTDFTAKLVDVYPPVSDYPDGLAMNITDSILRTRYRKSWEKPELMEPGNPYLLVFSLYPTSNVFKQGHRIRIDVSSSNWPRFDVNPNTGGKLGRKQGHRLAHQVIFHEPQRSSHVVLPIQVSNEDEEAAQNDT